MRKLAPVLLLLSCSLDDCRSPKERWQECKAHSRKAIRMCSPGCEADPSLKGEVFDKCLSDCSMLHFDKPLEICGPEPG